MYIKFSFQNLENEREDKNGRKYITSGFNKKKKISIYRALKLLIISKNVLDKSFSV